MTTPLATHDYTPGGLDAALEFLKRTRAELRSLRKVRVWTDHFHVIDVNKDYFEVRGVGYPDADIVPLLRAINTAFDPQTIHNPTTAEYKEFDTGRRHTWAEDRVM
ncbi:MAG TPA: hypothetical protein VKD72_09275 [Gemmataceae bacterium]|nr:hypothetical protein [Gemmataceae bacterium]